MPSVGLYTLGCKVSLYETEAVAEAFVKAGFSVLSFEDKCDVYVINTCTVTAESDAKSRKYIRRAVRKNPSAVVIVMGCYSQRAPGEVAKIEGVGAVIGTADKLSAVTLASELLSEREGAPIVRVGSLSGAKFENMCVSTPARTRGFVKIEDGCECKCSYCAIAGARGPVRSKPKEAVIAEVEALSRLGMSEIVLTGIETGSYGADFRERYGLSDLLSELNERKSCERIRLGSMSPELMGREFIERVSKLSILVPHFHISMQSGSSSVLRRMRRRYTRESAMENIRLMRRKIPRLMLTADLMVGFPGESEEDFQGTLDFVSEAELLSAHVFAYSKREGTPACGFPDQISESVKKDRSARLIAHAERVRDAVLDRVVADGRALPVVFETKGEGGFVGHSDSYIEVLAESDGDLTGKLLSVIPISHKNGVVHGKLL